MKEDVLEQIVDDYLQYKGYLTRHNLKFKPTKESIGYSVQHDCVHSDVDVIGFNPKLKGPDRVWVVSCKSWQSGFGVKNAIKHIESKRMISRRGPEKIYRELLVPRWTEAFLKAIKDVTGESEFTYVWAVTAIRDDRALWESYEPFKRALKGNPIRMICLSDILRDIYEDQGTTMASSEMGRLLQLIKASGWKN